MGKHLPKKTKNFKRKRVLPERECTCDKCLKTCNSTPGTKHRHCGGKWS